LFLDSLAPLYAGDLFQLSVPLDKTGMDCMEIDKTFDFG
jgi:hypothetical protein